MINFDQASTSFPKAPPVASAVSDFILTGTGNINRGSLNVSYETSKLVFKFREYLASYFGGKGKHTVFTKNVTESLNILIKGFFKAGGHLIVSALEHNAVMRPLEEMKKQGISYSLIPCGKDGRIESCGIKKLITPQTKAILTTAASNVCGTILPIKAIGDIAKEYGLPYFVDSAQLAGFLPIDMAEMGIDVLAVTGHKGLLGPQGIGALILSEELGKNITPLIAGGTGSLSEQFEMPDMLPDRLEAGTLNIPGIAGLAASVGWLSQNWKKVTEHEIMLVKRFLEGLEAMPDLPVKVIGLNSAESGFCSCRENLQNIKRVPVVSLDTGAFDASGLAYYLESGGGIATRTGLHCAPLAHKSLGTFPRGTVRFSFGYTQKPEEVDTCLALIKQYFTEEAL